MQDLVPISGTDFVGHVEAFYDKPMLEQENWTTSQLLEDVISENSWKD